jgi:hypothetical protein
VPLVAVFGAILANACGPPDVGATSSGGSAGGASSFGGFAGTAAAGTGALTACPPEPSGRIPGCSYGLIDADDDGFGDPARPHACCGDGGAVPLMIDCDDSDPNRALGAFPDADGDGRGAGEPICSTDPPPPGFSFPSGDCDDANRSIDWAESSDCPCERFLFDPVVPPNPACPSVPDLFVVDHEVCPMNCGQWLAFRIGNAGGVAAEGPIQVSMTVRSEVATLELETIGPGEASGWRRVPFLGFSGPATVTFLNRSSDCSPSRAPFEIELANSCM